MKKQESNYISREKFFKKCFAFGIGFTVLKNFTLAESPIINKSIGNNTELQKAKYWESLLNKKTRCNLCPNFCELSPEQVSLCHTRKNIDGTLYTMVYSKPSIITLDLIEKSPLYHYQVDGKVFSIATAGCNLTCQFCQNWELSQSGPDKNKTFDLSPAEVIEYAKKNNANAINFFYTEPFIYYEYMLDIAKLAKKEKMKTFCVTAGYVNSEPLKEIIPLIDAFVFGLKGFDNNFYKEYIGCELEPIKNSLKILAKNKDKTWFEIVNLLVPGLNDKDESIKEMCKWIKLEIGEDIPLHFTKFEPAYKLKDLSPTPIATLENAYKISKAEGLQYVYVGNIPGHDGNNTYCPRCNKKIIERVGFTVIKNNLKHGKCSCGHEISGNWIN